MQRFNAESLKIEIPDEKFSITAFIAGLGVQSKDLMFSISKNPQASIAEVLAKAEKYINGEEALISRRRALPPVKRKVQRTNDGDGAPGGRASKKNPQAKSGSDLLKDGETSEIAWVHCNPKDDGVTRPQRPEPRCSP